MSIYLAVKEIWYNKGRFLLIAAIVALITTLVLFIAALAEGLGNGNREYISKLNGELLVYQEKVDLSIQTSRLGRSKVAEVRRVQGVAAVGQIGFASAKLIFADGQETLDVSMIGVEPGLPGEPPVQEGRNFSRSRSEEVIVDQNVVKRRQIKVGESITVRVTQGTDEENYELKIVGISDGQQYSLRPSLFVPYITWDKIRPQATTQIGQGELVANLLSVKLVDPTQRVDMARKIVNQVNKVEVVDRVAAYEALPGYTAQQSTLNTQRYFTFFIGVLVIGGFFQIQTLQKIAQVGMLKAIGATNFTVATAAFLQIVLINALGVALGAVGVLGLANGLPPNVPAVFTGQAVATAIGTLLIIGPLGGLISVFALLRVEPLRALGLGQ